MPNSLTFGTDNSGWSPYGATTGSFPQFSHSAYSDINAGSDPTTTAGFSSMSGEQGLVLNIPTFKHDLHPSTSLAYTAGGFHSESVSKGTSSSVTAADDNHKEAYPMSISIYVTDFRSIFPVSLNFMVECVYSKRPPREKSKPCCRCSFTR